MKDREIIIIKTDKSSRFVVTNVEEYIKMGEAHTSKDRKINRKEINEIEKQLNGHCVAWAKMWGSGETWGHKGRIIDSKVTKSNNTADMYLLYKDHKKEKGKTRPVVTGCTSNTRGLSNSVSDLLESVANSEKDPYEAISSEDMLAKTKLYNENVTRKKQMWKEKRMVKILCKKCCLLSYSCNICKDETPSNASNTEFEFEIEKAIDKLLEKKCCAQNVKSKLAENYEFCGDGIREEDLEMMW